MNFQCNFHHNFQRLAILRTLSAENCELNIQIFGMYSSQKTSSNILLPIYQEEQTVFRLIDIAMITGETKKQKKKKNIIESRMEIPYKQYMEQCMAQVEMLDNTKLKQETLHLLAFYKDYPIFK